MKEAGRPPTPPTLDATAETMVSPAPAGERQPEPVSSGSEHSATPHAAPPSASRADAETPPPRPAVAATGGVPPQGNGTVERQAPKTAPHVPGSGVPVGEEPDWTGRETISP